MTGNLDMASFDIKFVHGRLRGYVADDWVAVMSDDGSQLGSLVVDTLTADNLRFPLAVPSDPLPGSVWYDQVNDVIKVYGGFPPAWHEH